jgi:KDO2-lipid IV(A) lauroyltransferase
MHIIMMRLGIGLLWLIHFLPQTMINGLAYCIGPILMRSRAARTAKINIRLCFPECNDAERKHIEVNYFRALVRSFLELGVVWFAPAEVIKQRVKLQDLHHYDAVKDGPVIFLAMHALGLEIGGARMGMEFKGVGFFTPHKNPLLDKVIQDSRDRLGDVVMLDRREGLRPMVRAIREGRRLYFLPDMDFGDRDSIFVPFFDIPAATVTTLPRLVALTKARVVPVTMWQEPGAQGYTVSFLPAWDNFPTEDLVADVSRMNAFVEAQARARPDQYFWGHKRFKTRPTSSDPYFY